MPDIVEATCIDPADRVISTDYGDRVVADFDVDGDEKSIWSDADGKEAEALRNLSEGQVIQLIKNEGRNGYYYTLRDSDVDRLAGEGQPPPQQGAPPQQAPPQGQQQNPHDPEMNTVHEQSKEFTRMVGNNYAFLDKLFAEKGENINTKPTSEDLRAMAINAAIAAVDQM